MKPHQILGRVLDQLEAGPDVWHKGSYTNNNNSAFCLYGHMFIADGVCAENIHENMHHTNDCFETAEAALVKQIRADHGEDLGEFASIDGFNDSPSTSLEDVVLVTKKVYVELLEEEDES